jgi:hypothetical protein
MKHTTRLTCILICSAVLLAPSAYAKVLLDFGNNTSYRGASTASPDVNGNYWNSVDSSVYWINLRSADGTYSGINFGFTSVSGTDSYNGPAGDTSASGTPNHLYTNVVIDAVALGDLGIQAAVFDYYVSSTFTLQNLDPASHYHLTFFGSHKYNPTGNDTTWYYVCTSQNYSIATAIASNSLVVGVGAAHNQNTVVTISNIAPQFANSIWIRFQGAAGGNGYLNCMRIDVVPEPVLLLSGMGVLVLLGVRRHRC